MNLINIAVDAMGGDNSPQKIIDGIENIIKKTIKYFLEFLEIKIIIENLKKKLIR